LTAKRKPAALIVGGGTGIGLAVAGRLLDRGMSVGISGRREPVLRQAREELLKNHPEATVEVHAADCGVEAQAGEMVAALTERLGGPAAFVDCAGIYEPCDFLELTAERWQATIGTTLDSTVYPAVAAARLMAEAGSGRMVLIASTNSVVSEESSTAYSAAKAAVSSLARSLCIDLAPRGIQVNAVAPGWVHTSMVGEFVQNASAEALARINPLGRVGKPDEIANLIEYLILDAPGYLTGSTIFIDGGQTAMAPLI
jgi:NAD(P)-dependent dehydrogenase (short-subunit alcohol dehydrogenase family)